MTSDVVVPGPETAAGDFHADAHSTAGFKALLLGSIGVVYGDIGTSPLYAFREAVMAAGGSAGAGVTSQAVLGVLSLVLWALIIVVTLKYVLILLRADNNGEGGTLALMALAQIGYGIAVVPSTVLVSRRLRSVPLVQRKTSIGRWVTIAWNSRRSLSAYAEQFVDELVAYCRHDYPGRNAVRRAPPLPRPDPPCGD